MKKYTTTAVTIAGLCASFSASALGIHEVLPERPAAGAVAVVSDDGRFAPRTIQDYVNRERVDSGSDAEVAGGGAEFGPRTIQDYLSANDA